MILKFNMFIIFSSFPVLKTDDVPYNADTLKRIKYKLTSMDFEVIQDALVKFTGVQHLRDEYHRSTPYQLGEVLCSINNLLNRMLRIFRRFRDGLIPDEVHLTRFTECHRYWFEIDHLLRMIELWEKKKAAKNSDNIYAMVQGDKNAARRYQELAAGHELEDEQIAEQFTRRPLSQTKSKRKNKLWHAGEILNS